MEGHAQVVAYGDHSGDCAKDAVQNTFVAVATGSGVLRMTKGYTTADCSSKVRVRGSHNHRASVILNPD